VLLDLGGDISGNGMSKLFLTIAAAFAEAERDRIRERVGQVKRDQKARGRFLGGTAPWGWRKAVDGSLEPVPEQQAAIVRMRQLRAEGVSLRRIMAQMGAEGHTVTLPTLMRLTGEDPDRGHQPISVALL
jgi:DNA invertase Pin-like site-specific DNA recombinase